MKLTDLQLDALVKEFSKLTQNQKENKEAKEALILDKKNIELSKKYDKILKQIPEPVRKKAYISASEKEFLNAIVLTQYNPKKEIEDYSMVRDIIVIESIEAKNLDDLRKRVNAKYK